MITPTPVNEMIPLSPKKYIVSKTNKQGCIEYGNDYFVEVSGYTEAELIGQPHSIIRHPDMPKLIFKMMWERVLRGQSIFAVVKNLAKDGRYYWVITEFETQFDSVTNEIVSITAFRKAATEDILAEMGLLYKKLHDIELISGVEGSEKYFKGFLEEKGVTYDEYIDKIIGNSGMFKLFFKAMKKIFS